jgi:RHS repeat-associated protein
MAGAWSRDYVPLAGRNVAKYAGSETYFIHQNALGSTTFVTDHAGTVQQGQLLYPRGEPWQLLGSSLDGVFAGLFPPDQYGFFSTPNRDYTPSHGLWLSPDPVGGDITNPQSLNRYAYVLNNPCTLTDSFGLDPCGFTFNLSDPGRLLSAGALATAQDTIARILADAGVGVVFTHANADFTATVLPANPSPGGTGEVFGHTPLTYWGWGPPGNVGDVYVNETYNELRTVGGGDIGVAVGNLATHEFSHFLFGAYPFGTPGSITQEGGWNASMMLNQGLQFAFPGAVQSKCTKLHPSKNNPTTSGSHPDGASLQEVGACWTGLGGAQTT